MSWKKKEYKLALEREQKHSGWLRSELLKTQRELAAAKQWEERWEALNHEKGVVTRRLRMAEELLYKRGLLDQLDEADAAEAAAMADLNELVPAKRPGNRFCTGPYRPGEDAYGENFAALQTQRELAAAKQWEERWEDLVLGPPPDPAPGRYIAETDAREYTPIRPEDLGFFDPKEPWVPPKDLERVHSRAEFAAATKEELERAKEGLRFTKVGLLFDPEPGPLLLDPDPDKNK